MKRHFFLTVLFFNFALFESVGQIPADIGLKAGINLSGLINGAGGNSVSRGYASRSGNNAAVYADLSFSKHLGVAVQLEYISQGGCKNGYQAFVVTSGMKQLFPADQAPDYLYASYKNTIQINSVRLPVLLKYRFSISGRLKCYIAAGPYISFVVAAHRNTSGNSIIYKDEQQTQPVSAYLQNFNGSENIRENLNAFNKGITGFMGMAYKLKTGKIFIEAGGSYGFYNIQRYEINGSNFMRTAMVEAGYQFPLNYKPGNKKAMLQ